jgi:hypothetical protein
MYSGPAVAADLGWRGDSNESDLRPRPMLSSFKTASILASQADTFSW